MKYLLDTNAVAALMRAEPRALERLLALPRSSVTLPEPVAAEIAFGIARLPSSKKKAALASRWRLFSDQLGRAPWTGRVSTVFGDVKAALEKQGKLIDDFDIAIVAHAIVYEATLVTHNAKHMARVPGLITEDWEREP